LSREQCDHWSLRISLHLSLRQYFFVSLGETKQKRRAIQDRSAYKKNNSQLREMFKVALSN